MTKVVFETATFADAIKHADKVAPGRGTAFDKAAGIIIEVTPELDPPVVVRATNLDVYHSEWVDSVEVEGGAAKWRVPSALLASVTGSLPIGTGKTISLEEVVKGQYSHLLLKSGRTKARINLMMTEYYPEWDVFDPDDLVSINDLGGRIALVEWAADKTAAPINGINFNGQTIVATDRYRLASTPLVVPNMPAPNVLVPAGILGSILKQTGEVKVGFTDTQMLLMPNETTQLRVVRFDSTYPNVEKIMSRERANFLEVDKAAILEVINRATSFAASDRLPVLRMWFGSEEIAVMMENGDQGTLGDVLEIPGQATHERVEIKFTPRNLTEAIEKAPNAKVKIGYDVEKPGSILYINGDSGYEAWVVTRASTEG